MFLKIYNNSNCYEYWIYIYLFGGWDCLIYDVIDTLYEPLAMQGYLPFVFVDFVFSDIIDDVPKDELFFTSGVT